MEQQNLTQFLHDSALYLGLEPAAALRESEINAEAGVREEGDGEEPDDVSLNRLYRRRGCASGVSLCGGVA